MTTRTEQTRVVGRICERGVRVPMASAGARAYNRGLGAEPPAGVQGQSPWWGVRGAPP